MTKLEKMIEYASMWGCESTYDHFPNEKGDGCLFYNFSHQSNEITFYEKFIPAIKRTIQSVKLKPELYQSNDMSELEQLLNFVQLCKNSLLL